MRGTKVDGDDARSERRGVKVFLEGLGGRGYTHPPGISYGYQKKGLANWAVCIYMKTREIMKGKKDKPVDSRQFTVGSGRENRRSPARGCTPR